MPSPARRVLLVDDCIDVTEMLGDLLRLEGHEVTVAHDGRSALELALSASFDVILLDLHLPEMDGRAVARELRARLGERCPRLVGITGTGFPTERGPEDSVFERVLVKPFDIHLVRAVIAGRRGSPTLPSPRADRGYFDHK